MRTLSGGDGGGVTRSQWPTVRPLEVTESTWTRFAPATRTAVLRTTSSAGGGDRVAPSSKNVAEQHLLYRHSKSEYFQRVLLSHSTTSNSRTSSSCKYCNRSCPSVRLIPLYVWTIWPLISIFYVCVGHGISSPGSDTQSCRSRSEVKSELFATRVATATSYECWFMAVVAGFHCDVISCQLARRGVRCGRGQRQRRIPARVGVVTQSVWPWSFVEGSILVCNFYRTKKNCPKYRFGMPVCICKYRYTLIFHEFISCKQFRRMHWDDSVHMHLSFV